MAQIKIKFADLFSPGDFRKLQSGLESLLKFKARSAALKYDIEIKLNKAVTKAIQEFEDLRTSLCREHSNVKTIINPDGTKEDTYYVIEPVKEKDPEQEIVRVDGTELQGVIAPRYDIKDMQEYSKRFKDLLETEIELDCYPVKLSKLEAEEDLSGIDFSSLEKFIINDMG